MSSVAVALVGLAAQAVAADGRTVSGQVVGPDGKPVPGAAVWGHSGFEPRFLRRIAGTDAEGRFRGELEPDAEVSRLRLVATAEGFGFGWESAGDFLPRDESEVGRQTSSEPPTIRLKAPASVSGGLIDADGRPVKGVRVRPIFIWDFGTDGPTLAVIDDPETQELSLEDALRKGRKLIWTEPGDALFDWAETDAEGRFEVEGVGANRVVQLLVVGPRTAAGAIYVRTDDGPEVSLSLNPADPNADRIPIRPRDGFRHTVSPSVPVTGVVRRLDTRRPLFGAVVRPWRVAALPDTVDSGRYLAVTTGLEGRFVLEGLPVGETRCYAMPPKDQPILPALLSVERSVEIDARTERVEADFGLPRGVTVTGRVTDAATGDPVPGRIEYFAFTDNEQLDKLTDGGLSIDRNGAAVGDDGAYALPVLPGPGLLAFSAAKFDDYPQGAGVDEITRGRTSIAGRNDVIKAEPSYVTGANYHLLKPIDVAADVEAVTIDLSLGGDTREVAVTFVAASGERRRNHIYYSNATRDGDAMHLVVIGSRRQEEPQNGVTYEEGVIRFFGGDDRRRLVQAVSSDHTLAGWAFVTPDEERVEITLHKAAKVRGRLIDADGKPVAGAQLRTEYNDDPLLKKGQLVSHPQTGYTYWTDAEGRFEFDGLPGDLPLSVEVSTEDDRGRSILRGLLFADLEVEAGKVRDLGDIRFDKLQPLRR